MGKRGPKPRGEYADQSEVFSSRIRPDLKAMVVAAAKKSGRSVSQEFSDRVRRTFVDDEKISELFGDQETFYVMRVIALAIHRQRLNIEAKVGWLDDPFYFQHGLVTTLAMLEAIRPPGEIVEPDNWLVSYNATARTRTVAAHLWRNVRGSDPALPLTEGTRLEHKLGLIKSKIGRISERATIADGSSDEIWNFTDRLIGRQPSKSKKSRRKKK